MRIIAGIAKGLTIVVPAGATVRPTSDRVRGAIFSSLGNRVPGATVLDLFAGSGALGLEAASRGARAVTFVEQDAGVLESLCRNAKQFPYEFRFVCGDVFDFVRGGPESFDLILADPPYGEWAQRLVNEPSLPGLLAEGGVWVLESAKRNALVLPATWSLLREAVYGDTRVSFLQRSPPAAG